MPKVSTTTDYTFPADLDAETRALLEQAAATAGSVPPSKEVVAKRVASRQVFLSMEGEAKVGALIKCFDIAGRGGAIPVRLYIPEVSSQSPSPLVIFFHGGGWSLGDLDCYDGLCADVCAQASVKILSVEYRLSPETPFPGGLEDCMDAINWAFESASQLNIDSEQIALMGDSAGGNLAAVAAEKLAEDNKPALVAQFLIYPMLDIGSPHDTYPSRTSLGNGEFLLDRQGIDDAINWYVPDGKDLSNPSLSPTNTQNAKLLPPTYLMSAKYDPLFDECRQYAEKLKVCDKLVSHRIYPSIHAFLSFGVFAIAHVARKDLARDVRAAFGLHVEPIA